MYDSQQQEKVLQISGQDSGSITVSLDAAEPVTVRLDIEAKCGCQDNAIAVNRPGSYVDTEPARHKK